MEYFLKLNYEYSYILKIHKKFKNRITSEVSNFSINVYFFNIQIVYLIKL